MDDNSTRVNRDELTGWDRDHFFHPSTHMAGHARGDTANRVVTGGSGVRIEDRDGKVSLDAFAGLYWPTITPMSATAANLPSSCRG